MTIAPPFARHATIVLSCWSLQLAACGGADVDRSAGPLAAASSPAAAAAAAPAASALPTLWAADGRAPATPPEDRPADPAYAWSGQRFATRAQLAHEETVAQPYTVVIQADDEAAVESGLQYAEVVNQYGGGKQQMGLFVRSRHPALAARLAERLTQEQGWAHVFVVH